MNAHIWELDKCENKNGKLLKSTMDDINLQILNCVWDSMKGATWFSEKSELLWTTLQEINHKFINSYHTMEI